MWVLWWDMSVNHIVYTMVQEYVKSVIMSVRCDADQNESTAITGNNEVQHCTTLHCTVLHRTVLYCTALHCTVLYCTALHCTVLHCTALYCTALHCTALYCTSLHCTALYCTALNYIDMHCTALHCTVLCDCRSTVIRKDYQCTATQLLSTSF